MGENKHQKAVTTYITHALQNGIPAKYVSTITGKTVKVINRHYAGIDEDDLVNKVRPAFSWVLAYFVYSQGRNPFLLLKSRFC